MPATESLPAARPRRTLARVSEASPRSPQLGALVALVFLAVLLRTAWLSDDALITLRTVLNWTHGYGLTFNIAERVQTFTHPLWMLLLTGFYLLVGNVYYATFALSIGVSLVVFWLMVRGTASAAQAWMVAGVLLLSRAFVDFSSSRTSCSSRSSPWRCARGRMPAPASGCCGSSVRSCT